MGTCSMAWTTRPPLALRRCTLPPVWPNCGPVPQIAWCLYGTKRPKPQLTQGFLSVGLAGFEPATS